MKSRVLKIPNIFWGRAPISPIEVGTLVPLKNTLKKALRIVVYLMSLTAIHDKQ
jgi:hypothetical protein